MFILGTTHMPPGKAPEVARRFVKAVETPMPPFIKRVMTLVSAAGEQWFKSIAIFEVDDAKVTDGIKEVMKYETQFLDIEGYKYQLEVMLKPEEAITLLGICCRHQE